MSRYNGNMGIAFDLSLGRQPIGNDTARQNAYATATAAAGLSTISDDRLLVARRQDDHELHDLFNDGTTELIDPNNISELEAYVRALHCEREKLDAFRRELPICMGLLDDAIEASSVRLIKAVEGSIVSRTAASYSTNTRSATMNNNSSTTPYSINSSMAHSLKQLGMVEAGGSVPNTPGRVSLLSSEQAITSLWPCNNNNNNNMVVHDQPHATSTKSGTCPSNWRNSSKLPGGSIHNPGAPNISSSHAADAVQLHLMSENFQSGAGASTAPVISRWSAASSAQQEQALAAAPMIKKEEIYKLKELSRTDHNMDAYMRNKEHMECTYNNMAELEHPVRYKERGTPTEFARPDNNNITHNISMNTCGGGGQPPRKVRRCWSPELHQRFLHALHQLGGPQLATPKQIREVMHVDGLTNDEVKSHLQKYRLHTRRPPLLQTCETASQQQPHHLLLFGGIWVPTASSAESGAPHEVNGLPMGGGGGAPSHSSNAPFNMQFPRVISGQTYTSTSQTVISATSSDQLDNQAGMEVASEVDVARSDQSTSLNGEVGASGDHIGQHIIEEEDTEIHLGSKLL